MTTAKFSLVFHSKNNTKRPSYDFQDSTIEIGDTIFFGDGKSNEISEVLLNKDWEIINIDRELKEIHLKEK